ncbi:MAG: nucleoid-associated protein [Gammaproteobacteria bacterium]
MDIKNVIIHQISKEQIGQPSVIKPGDGELSTKDDAVKDLIEELRKVYNAKTSKTYGVFDEDQDSYPFQKKLQSHMSKELGFEEFTEWSLGYLKIKVDAQNFATGGYLLFVRYKEAEKEYLMVVMLNDKSGVGINQTSLTVEKLKHLELDKLHLAVRVSLTDWDAKAASYLSFIKGRAKEYSGYFLEFVGCTTYTPAKKSTRTLVTVLTDFCDEKKLSDEDAQALRHKVHDYCNAVRKEKKPLDLRQLSHSLNADEPDEFFEFANADKYGLSAQFDVDLSEIKKLRRYQYKAPSGWQLSFPDELLDKEVVWNKKDKTITIVNVPDSFDDVIK